NRTGDILHALDGLLGIHIEQSARFDFLGGEQRFRIAGFVDVERTKPCSFVEQDVLDTNTTLPTVLEAFTDSFVGCLGVPPQSLGSFLRRPATAFPAILQDTA